jgi:hypothetical protein
MFVEKLLVRVFDNKTTAGGIVDSIRDCSCFCYRTRKTLACGNNIHFRRKRDQKYYHMKHMIS